MLNDIDLSPASSPIPGADSTLPPPPTPDYVDPQQQQSHQNANDDGEIKSYLSNLNAHLNDNTSNVNTSNDNNKMLLYLARADALLQQFQQSWNELIVCDFIFFFL